MRRLRRPVTYVGTNASSAFFSPVCTAHQYAATEFVLFLRMRFFFFFFCGPLQREVWLRQRQRVWRT